MHARALALAVTFTVIALFGRTTPGRSDEARHGAHAMRMPADPNASRDDFTAGMAAAMQHMDAGMSIRPSRNPDRDFAAMMIPHHQGAVDMALLELQYGSDPVLKRLAQEIVVTQRQEIEVMRRALAAMPSPGTPR